MNAPAISASVMHVTPANSRTVAPLTSQQQHAILVLGDGEEIEIVTEAVMCQFQALGAILIGAEFVREQTVEELKMLKLIYRRWNGELNLTARGEEVYALLNDKA